LKKSIYTICFLVLCSAAQAQKYKSAEDTVKLNKEWTDLTADIKRLEEKLNDAQSKLVKYESRAKKAQEDARDAANRSEDRADKAEKGDLKDVKKAKRDADKAYKEAKAAENAKEDVADQKDKIESLKGQLAKKQERLGKLADMRKTIYSRLE
jgi:chromosome segregation ATPase